MKKIILSLAAFLMLTMGSIAQNDSIQTDEIKTLFGSHDHSNGWYVGLGGGYSQIDDKNAFTTSFRSAWIINHSFAIGLAATGFSNDLYVGHESGSDYSSVQGGYAGLLLQPVIFPKFPVHVSFPVLLGVGGAMSLSTYYNEPWEPYWDIRDESYYFIIEPAAEIELNLIKWIRLSAGLSYRFTTPLNLYGYSDDVLRGFGGNVTLSFGKF
ncbi:MAG TPA: hypothetical protein DHV29_11795 [Bacteroidales bacterium]|nr:MAG: hypothetical protein A2W94_09915 [Bacteroidetes bacterium GWE2_42_42]HCB61036.1 hypothetical protein [Bacteroidales bacterium]HCY24158.1 hypothetical protein [Bacteroidales bacterium]